MGTLTYTTLGGIVAAAPNVASDVTTAFTQAQTSINNVQDDQYINKNNQVWRTVMQTTPPTRGGQTANTYWVATNGSLISSGGTTTDGTPAFAPSVAGDYAVTGKTTTYRLSVNMACNATTCGTTITFGVYPVTTCSGGSANVLGYTLGSVVAGSTVAHTGTANSIVQSTSSTFTLGTSSAYVIAYAVAGTTSAAHTSQCTALLQMSHV